ncbi:MAG: class I SAM-dependent methyltransferase [Methyloligellaceae bacterium]
MSNTHVDEDQRRRLEIAAAARIKWWNTIERASKPVSEALIAMAGLQDGHRVLDVATGLGEPAGMASVRVGPAGHVTAVDINPAQIAFAKSRLTNLNCDNVALAVADAQTLDLDERSFDAVLCRWGLMFLPDLPLALDGLRRLVRDGGRIAAAAWAASSEVPFLDVERQVLAEHLPDDYFAGDNDLTTPFRLSEPGHLQRVMSDAGLAEVRCEPVDVTHEFPSPADYTTFRRDMGRRDQILAKHHPTEKVEEIWNAVTEAAHAFAGKDGIVRMKSTALCAVGSR